MGSTHSVTSDTRHPPMSSKHKISNKGLEMKTTAYHGRKSNVWLLDKLQALVLGIMCFALLMGTTNPVFALGEPYLVKDINTTPYRNNGPSSPTYVNGTIFFADEDAAHGTELWKTDGTVAGTVLVKDISPGTGGSSPSGLTAFNGILYFAADDGIHGRELWKSDGTEAGTVLVIDINSNAGQGSTPQELTLSNGILYFTADEPTHSRELWRSDGTESGTVLVKDIYPGPWVFERLPPSNLTDVNGTLYFIADDGVYGSEIWKSNGAEAGTVLVKDVAGPGFSRPDNLTNVNGTLYFTHNDGTSGTELWKSNGTATGTVLVKDIYPGSGSSSPTGLTNVNGVLFFSATDGTNGVELWKSNGTTAGTVLVKDIYPGGTSFSSNPNNLKNMGGTLYFTASDGVNGTELWKSDGTAAGTVLGKDIYPGQSGSSPTSLTVMNGILYFSADENGSGMELWRSDGTTAGTSQVKDIYVGGSSSPKYLTNLNGALYFQAYDGVSGTELWKSDGTASGTIKVSNSPQAITASSTLQQITNVYGTLFFTTDDGVHGTELWKSDATSAGTVMVKDINPTGSSSPYYLTNLNGALYFRADDGVHGTELWKSDGSQVGTTLVKEINPAGNANPVALTKVNNTIYFKANDGVHGDELWKTNGTENGTVLVKDINPGSGSSLASSTSFLEMNGTLYFLADDGINGTELWKSDGTEAGTMLVKNIALGSASVSIGTMITIDGVLYFTPNDGVNGAELWKSDGTETGTVLVKDINPGTGSATPSQFLKVSGFVYFVATNSANGKELWRTDGTEAGTMLVKDIRVGTGSSSPNNLTELNGSLYFTANDGANGTELWKSDGTDTGTILVKDIYPGTNSSTPVYLSNENGILYFNANDGVHGGELWKSDGTEAGTMLVMDIDPGSGSSSIPERLKNVNGELYFKARNNVNGYELWKTDGSEAGTVLVKDIYAGTADSYPQYLTTLNEGLIFAASDRDHGFELWALGNPTIIAPSAPTIYAATAGNGQAIVTFTPPLSNGGSPVTGFTVRSIPPGGTDIDAGTTSLTHAITGLTNGIVYTFIVSATNATGTGADSTPSASAIPATDSDGDGVVDPQDNCPTLANADQADTDNDAIGDVCDSKPNTANYGSVIDAPHNETRGITCVDCHSYSLWWQHSPVSANTAPAYAAITNAVCTKCHAYVTHSSITPGDFSVTCVECHSAHDQGQVEWRSIVPNELYLVNGSITGGFVVDKGQTTFNYSLSAVTPEWSDPAVWRQKDGLLPPSGLILVVDTTNATNTYEVINATGTTITVKGGIDPNKAGNTFGLIYGQMIKKSIATMNEGNKDVKFFNPKNPNGGYTDNNTPATGICQVCHEKSTMSWNSSGSGSNPTHDSGLNCVECHTMTQGFMILTEELAAPPTKKPVITINGSPTVSVEVGTAYVDAGATAVDQHQVDLSGAIVVANPVNTAALGIYPVTYDVQDSSGNSAVQITRTVNVVDTTAPVITLNGSANQTVECSGTYIDPGANVTDNASTALTATATGTVNTATAETVSTLYYNAQDNAGNNAAEVTRKVTVQDTTRPTIRLTGGSTVYVPVGGIYNENGATASDACGVSSPVTISGTVDTGTTGTYILTYDVLDNAGNPADQVTRTVQVRTEDACAGHPSIAGALNNSVALSSSAFPDMQIVLSTKETAYAGTAVCVPVFVQMTNTGTAPINLNATQAASLSNMSIGLYRSARIFNENLANPSGQAIQPGMFLLPGESTYFSTQFSRERLAIYTVPPLGGGVVQTGYSIQGPFGASGIVGISLRNFTNAVDFGALPSSRAPELGAGVDFIAGELLVKFKNGVTILQAEAIVKQNNCHVVSNISNYSGWLLNVSIPFDKTTEQMMSTFSYNPSVQYSERNATLQLH